MIDINYAVLDIYFTSDLGFEEIASIMENELTLWITKYPVPTLVYPLDKTEDTISIGSIRKGDFLMGYVDDTSKNIAETWGDYAKLIHSKNIKHITDEKLNSLYRGLAFKTIDDQIKESNEEIRTKHKIKRFMDVYFFSWLLVSILILVAGFKSYLVGVLAFLYSLYQLYKKARSFKGHKTAKQLEDAKKKLEMDHYYYHCELNPKGFLRLKQENSEKMSQDKLRNQKEAIEAKDI